MYKNRCGDAVLTWQNGRGRVCNNGRTLVWFEKKWWQEKKRGEKKKFKLQICRETCDWVKGKVTKTSSFLHGANILMNTVLPAVSESQLSGVSLIAEAVARVVMIAVLNMVEDSVIMCGWSVE